MGHLDGPDSGASKQHPNFANTFEPLRDSCRKDGLVHLRHVPHWIYTTWIKGNVLNNECIKDIGREFPGCFCLDTIPNL